MSYDLTKTFTDTEREILQKFRTAMNAIKDLDELRADLNEFFGGRFSGNVNSIAAHFNALESRSDIQPEWISEMNSDTWSGRELFLVADGQTTLTNTLDFFDNFRHWL